jgi:hypothetical protein
MYIVKVEKKSYASIKVDTDDNVLAQYKVEQMIQNNEIEFTGEEITIKTVEEL